jgi:nitrite reductase (NADH) large subunit
MLNQRVKVWVCQVCGYVHYGPEPPDECPVCGAVGAFELSTEEAPPGQVAGAAEAGKVVIVGAGIAGVSAAESLRKAAPQAEIVLISNEAHFPYYRMNLTRYLAGEVSAEQLLLHPQGWYAENNVQLLLGAELSKIDLAQKELTLKDDSRIAYDKLILATGSHPFVPPFPGANRKNVITLRTRKDADDILETRLGKKCACIGGGLLGLETAGGLARQGMDVTVLENQPWLLPRQLNEAASKLFQEKVKSKGIAVRTRAQTREITGDECARGILLDDGTTIPADLVIISAGIRSNVELARQAGLEVKQGIIVDSRMRTSNTDVFAAGDVAEYKGILYGLWAPSQIQGTVAGMNASGQEVEFTGVPRSSVLKVLGIDLFNIGKISPEDAADRLVETEFDGRYYSFVFRDNRMVGAILLGDTSLASQVKKVVEGLQDCSKVSQDGTQVKDVLQFLGGA